jgi:hypothetical protein
MYKNVKVFPNDILFPGEVFRKLKEVDCNMFIYVFSGKMC